VDSSAGGEPQTPNQALQQTAGHDSFLGLIAHRCPAAAELCRSACAFSLRGSATMWFS
jgi:hypothetical protein